MFKYENTHGLPQEEVLDAIKQGVREAFFDSLDQGMILEAIQEGIKDAFPDSEYIEQAITKGTSEAFSE